MTSRNRILSQLPSRGEAPQSPRFTVNGYEADTTEVVEIGDMSNKYGIGYLLANGSQGVIFNDGTSLTKQPEGALIYYDKTTVEYASVLALPHELKKKTDILRLAQKNFKKETLITYPSQVIVKKYVKFEHSTIILKLSSGTLQFFWPDGQLSLRSGSIVHIDTPATIADGAQTQHLGKLTFPVIQALVEDIVTVTDAQLVQAMAFAASRMKMLVEPTGCLAIAAALNQAVPIKGLRVGLLVSGGNIDLARFAQLVQGD